MKTEPYRTHEDGPLTTLYVEPGAVCVLMDFDVPWAFTKLHSHSFDHWLECLSGSASITIDDFTTVIKAGDKYMVEAHKRHSVWPLEDNTKILCRHEHEDIHPSKTDGENIPLEWLWRLTDKEEVA